ncbi:S-formylglutathione hydrolase [Rubrobacter radiotolerans]|uniref:S-formylglutathione hydrolase n=1 Tax=Rubrobacter radiotolerans TaxID=42256 RepID=A0A023X4W3_RUBRA|nr:S-formylglutathione hydrolase [Rubrobacter radiotolerans]AHY47266.1 S-formylglutathione hydrolase [Rubrobacter radiotolerans]MDX5894671.1 S-formylglutathione hydrolase [Rubrobacter radiotolerans]SMC06512.1 S-formylglutathione hydrolase [Rubrobacter radiotolerans DSM 5868]
MAKHTSVETGSEKRCFGGTVGFYSHDSEATGTRMNFSVYVPPAASEGPVPVLYYLAGLTCTEETFQIKAGAQRYAAEHGLILVAPDTSPRGVGNPGEDEDYDFGTGAGFYIDATREPWSENYNMYSYVSRELPEVVAAGFPADTERQGIFGHSMGGHGALTIALKNPERYRSVSAFAPICNPSEVPWGEKAFSGYLANRSEWRDHDATEIVRAKPLEHHILIDQGMDDEFLEEQLSPDAFEAACRESGQKLTLRRHPGYDHSYYFISTFMEDHIEHHAQALVE